VVKLVKTPILEFIKVSLVTKELTATTILPVADVVKFHVIKYWESTNERCDTSNISISTFVIIEVYTLALDCGIDIRV
jgi:hypothetical protein